MKATQRAAFEMYRCTYSGVFCKSGRSSGTIAPSTGHTCRQIPQSMQVEKSIQYQSVPLVFFSGPGWIQATGQASTQSATPSQVLVTMVCGMDSVFSARRIYSSMTKETRCWVLAARDKCLVLRSASIVDILVEPCKAGTYAFRRWCGCVMSLSSTPCLLGVAGSGYGVGTV